MSMLFKKEELVNTVAEEMECTKVAAEKAIQTIFGAIAKEVVENGKDFRVPVLGGTFKKVDVAAREAHNPSTGAVVQVPAKWKVRFAFKPVEKK